VAAPELHDLDASLPSISVSRFSNTMVGHVRPGTDSTAWKSRGKRSISLFMSCSPRSTIRS
jgi:hypothetical protein